LPVAKLRGTSERSDPGRGGINIARVIKRLGGDAHAIYPVGGLVGNMLRKLLDEESVTSHTSTIAGETREGFFVNEISTGPSQSWHRIVPFGRRQTSCRSGDYRSDVTDPTRAVAFSGPIDRLRDQAGLLGGNEGWGWADSEGSADLWSS
jgi:hypothetical protein